MIKFKVWLKENFDQISNAVSSVLSILLSMIASYFYENIKNEERTTGKDIYLSLIEISEPTRRS